VTVPWIDIVNGVQTLHEPVNKTSVVLKSGKVSDGCDDWCVIEHEGRYYVDSLSEDPSVEAAFVFALALFKTLLFCEILQGMSVA
jgi:hypothetical protein